MPTRVFQAGIYEKNLGGFNLLQKNIGYDMNITSLKQGRGKSFGDEKKCFVILTCQWKLFQAGIYDETLRGIDLLQKNIGYDTNITSLKQ
jgi:hypothetical protein